MPSCLPPGENRKPGLSSAGKQLLESPCLLPLCLLISTSRMPHRPRAQIHPLNDRVDSGLRHFQLQTLHKHHFPLDFWNDAVSLSSSYEQFPFQTQNPLKILILVRLCVIFSRQPSIGMVKNKCGRNEYLRAACCLLVGYLPKPEGVPHDPYVA